METVSTLTELLGGAQRGRLLSAWLAALRRDPICGQLATMDEAEFLCDRFLEALNDAVREKPWDVTSAHFRDAVKTLAFIGGWLGELDAPPSWAALLTAHLRRCMSRLLGDRPLEDELVEALETMGAGAVETYIATLREKHRHACQETLRRVTPVLRLPNNVPTLLVVGNPERDVVGDLMSRLLVEVVRRDAPRYIIDVSGLEGDPTVLCRELIELVQYKRMGHRTLYLVGAEPPFVSRLRELGIDEAKFVLSGSVDEALAAIADSP